MPVCVTYFFCQHFSAKSLYSFGASATDDQIPCDGLIRVSAGNLCGTTYQGGEQGDGTVFEISGGVESVLYAFLSNRAAEGSRPTAARLRTSAGVLYGTTYQGGAHNEGTVFRVN